MGHMWIKYCRWICGGVLGEAPGRARLAALPPAIGGGNPLDQRPHSVQERCGGWAMATLRSAELAAMPGSGGAFS